jgi:hypothetical protein
MIRNEAKPKRKEGDPPSQKVDHYIATNKLTHLGADNCWWGALSLQSDACIRMQGTRRHHVG